MGWTTAKLARLNATVGRGLEGFRARLQEPVELQPSGVEELDALLGGGFPRGALVEVCGAGSSGRTSLSLALLAQATRRQEACAYVDVSDALDPMSVAAAGVDVKRLLWVRCGAGGKAEVRAEIEEERSKPLHYNGAGALSQKDGAAQEFPVQERPHGFAWTHPRDAMRGVETSIPGLMRRPPKAPSYDEMSFAVRCAGEQVEPDRQEPRRGENARRKVLPHSTGGNLGKGEADSKASGKSLTAIPQRLKPMDCRAHNGGAEAPPPQKLWTRTSSKPWKRLEQSLKATDLLLHSGGWGVVVVDLGGISWVEARRIPMHTWFRFRRVVENSPTILLLLGEESCAKSCASLVLECRRMSEKWSTTFGSTTNVETKLGPATLQGFEVQGEIASSRMQRLGVHAARWQTRMIGNGE
jgi:recombination protein RecA